jgi:hypothetical protein
LPTWLNSSISCTPLRTKLASWNSSTLQAILNDNFLIAEYVAAL